MTTTFIILNSLLALVAVGAVYALVLLAHRLPTAAPHHDESWGVDRQRVPSDPLPLHQVTVDEDEREYARAA
jgi:hypothetical protein